MYFIPMQDGNSKVGGLGSRLGPLPSHLVIYFLQTLIFFICQIGIIPLYLCSLLTLTFMGASNKTKSEGALRALKHSTRGPG